jgi:hypothetical protein
MYHLDFNASAVQKQPLCLGVTMDFCELWGVILNLKAFCFEAIPDIMIELIVYGSVPQSRQSEQWLSVIETKLLRQELSRMRNE